MSRLKLLLFCLLMGISGLLPAQDNMPSYLDVVRHFFSNYSHEREEPYDRVFFAKKKDGWHVNIIDITKEEKIKDSQLFWDLSQRKYNRLNNFGGGLEENEINEKIDSFLDEDGNSFLLYNYERCRYHGYNRWDIDMIEDFGDREITEDTLLEGMGRAYSSYAERYLWSGSGGYPYDNDRLKSKLGKLEMPGKERIEQFLLNKNRSVAYYKKL